METFQRKIAAGTVKRWTNIYFSGNLATRSETSIKDNDKMYSLFTKDL
jgi:hypothetical protein